MDSHHRRALPGWFTVSSLCCSGQTAVLQWRQNSNLRKIIDLRPLSQTACLKPLDHITDRMIAVHAHVTSMTVCSSTNGRIWTFSCNHQNMPFSGKTLTCAYALLYYYKALVMNIFSFFYLLYVPLAGMDGLEPTTHHLTGDCSAIELHPIKRHFYRKVSLNHKDDIVTIGESCTRHEADFCHPLVAEGWNRTNTFSLWD